MKNTPNIRFRGFDDDWEQRKVSDTCKINGRIGFRGYTEKDIISKEAGGVLTFSPTNIVDNKLTMDCKNTYITRKKYDESPEIMIKNGDILFVKTGSTLGKSALVTGLDEDASINPQIVVMRVEEGTEAFFSNVLITQDVLKQVAAVRIGGAVPTMTETELKNFVYYEPASKAEKVKIGEYFSSLDNLITLHQRKLNLICYIFKTWEQRKLGECGETYTGLSGKTKDDFGHGDARFVTYMNVFSNPIADKDRVEAVEIDKSQNCVQYGDVFFTTSSETPEEVGMSCVWLENTDNTYLNSFCFGYRPTINIDPYFMAYVLRSNTVRKKIVFLAQGISRYNISKNKVIEIEIPLPTLEEQMLLGKYFDELDNLITLHRRTIS